MNRYEEGDGKRSNINVEHDGKRNNHQGLTEIYRENAAIPSHHG